jgi:hypothetical protein
MEILKFLNNTTSYSITIELGSSKDKDKDNKDNCSLTSFKD